MAEKKETAPEAVETPAEKPAKAPAKRPAAKAADETAAAKPATRRKATAEAEVDEKPAAKAPAKAAKAAKPAEKAEKAAVEPSLPTLKVHHLRPAPGAHTPKTRVGRGEASKGKTAGRGTKGTKARYQVPERFEGGQMPMHMRLPKLRGFKNPFRTEYQVVNLDKLAVLYPSGGDVTVEDLVAKGAVSDGAPVKVLGTGEVNVKLTVSVQKVSASAAAKIEAAGGTIQQA